MGNLKTRLSRRSSARGVRPDPPTPTSLKETAISALLAAKIDRKKIKEILEGFARLPPEVKNADPKIFEFFESLEEAFREESLDQRAVFALLLETLEDDPARFQQVAEQMERFESSQIQPQLVTPGQQVDFDQFVDPPSSNSLNFQSLNPPSLIPQTLNPSTSALDPLDLGELDTLSKHTQRSSAFMLLQPSATELENQRLEREVKLFEDEKKELEFRVQLGSKDSSKASRLLSRSRTSPLSDSLKLQEILEEKSRAVDSLTNKIDNINSIIPTHLDDSDLGLSALKESSFSKSGLKNFKKARVLRPQSTQKLSQAELYVEELFSEIGSILQRRKEN